MATAFAITYDGDKIPFDIPIHRYRIVTGKLQFSDSYPAGGEVLDLTLIFPRGISLVLIEPRAGYQFVYDYTNKKVIAYWTPSGHTGVFAEITATTDLHTTCATVGFVVFGKE